MILVCQQRALRLPARDREPASKPVEDLPVQRHDQELCVAADGQTLPVGRPSEVSRLLQRDHRLDHPGLDADDGDPLGWDHDGQARRVGRPGVSPPLHRRHHRLTAEDIEQQQRELGVGTSAGSIVGGQGSMVGSGGSNSGSRGSMSDGTNGCAATAVSRCATTVASGCVWSAAAAAACSATTAACSAGAGSSEYTLPCQPRRADHQRSQEHVELPVPRPSPHPTLERRVLCSGSVCRVATKRA